MEVIRILKQNIHPCKDEDAVARGENYVEKHHDLENARRGKRVGHKSPVWQGHI